MSARRPAGVRDEARAESAKQTSWLCPPAFDKAGDEKSEGIGLLASLETLVYLSLDFGIQCGNGTIRHRQRRQIRRRASARVLKSPGRNVEGEPGKAASCEDLRDDLAQFLDIRG